MNIILKTAGGHIIVRPDTTWSRKSEDLYLPDFVSQLSYTPVLFARISKSGRSVESKFASRYYDCVGYGIMIYPDDLDDGSTEGVAAASCLDKTSCLPLPMYQSVVLGHEENVFSLSLDGREIYRSSHGTASMVEDALCEASRLVYIRTGDFIAIELAARCPLCSRDCREALIEASYCGNYLMEFKLIF